MFAREEKLSDDEDQALAAQFKKGKKKDFQKKSQKFDKGKKNYSKVKCFCCENFGHVVRDCPLIKEVKEGRKVKRHHAHVVEDEEPIFKKGRNEVSDDEYVLVAALTNLVNYDGETWLVDSGASRHMTGFKDSFSNLTRKYSPH